jgi:beta-lactamase class A
MAEIALRCGNICIVTKMGRELAVSLNWTNVEDVVRDAEKRGCIGVSIAAPDGQRWNHNAERTFRAASVVKIPLMIEIFRQIDRRQRTLDDVHVLQASEKAPGSGVLLHLHDGIEVTINDLLYLMISISDNTATNLLIDMAGMDAVNATMRELGMSKSTLKRPMRGRPAEAGEPENLATTADYVAVLEAILDQRAASQSSCDAMIQLLEKQQNERRISRYLPKDDRIRWGSKTGSLNGVTNDAGFILNGDKRLVLAVFCEDFPDQHTGEQVIGDISRAAMRATGIVEPLTVT